MLCVKKVASSEMLRMKTSPHRLHPTPLPPQESGGLLATSPKANPSELKNDSSERLWPSAFSIVSVIVTRGFDRQVCGLTKVFLKGSRLCSYLVASRRRAAWIEGRVRPGRRLPVS